jgi:hypothetical protein
VSEAKTGYKGQVESKNGERKEKRQTKTDTKNGRGREGKRRRKLGIEVKIKSKKKKNAKNKERTKNFFPHSILNPDILVNLKFQIWSLF